MRLFVGLEVPEDVAGELAQVVHIPHGLRSVVPADLHVTLVFLGEVPEARLPALTQALREVRAAEFRVELGAYATLGGGLVLECAPSPELIELQAEVANRLEREGFPREARPYRPHVTLARGARGRRVPLPEGGVGELGFAMRDFVLYRSRLGGAPPFYDRHQRFPLRAE